MRRITLSLALTLTAVLGALGQANISQNATALHFVTLFNAVAATATATSAATRLPTFSGFGILSIVGAGIAGAPVGCQIALNYQQSLNSTNSAVMQTVAFTPANSYLTSQITPAVTLANGQMLVGVYTCTTYPTAGTLTVTFDPSEAAAITNTPNINLAQVAGTTTVTGGLVGLLGVRQTDGTNLTPIMDVAARAAFQKITDGTNTLPTGDAAARKIFVQPTDGTNNLAVDPCDNLVNTRTSTNINQTAGAQLITGVAAKQTYICSLNLVTATAQNIALVEGTGVVCATGIAGMAGGTTAATGWNFAANGGLVSNGGGRWVFKTATAADNVCLLQSGAGQISGNMTSVQQ